MFGKGNVIIFESVPDFSDNPYAVYQEMIRRDLHKKYKILWSCSKDVTMPQTPAGVGYIYPLKKTVKERLRNMYYMANAKCMVCCNRFLVPWRKSQPCFYLTHGTTIKQVRGYYNLPEPIQYCLSAAPAVAELTADALRTDINKMFSLGFPRNDVLLTANEPIREMLGTTCKKVIVWYPTFRQHASGSNVSSGNALPVIHDQQAALELNQWAKDLDILLVLKPHFAQDLSQIKALDLSNIRFIDDEFFRIHNIGSYAFVASCDALLSDYSSIYYDYLLCDKPVGLVWEDIEEYRQNPGFAVDLDVMCKGGVKIYNLEDFKSFLKEVAEETDSCGEARREIRDLTNYKPDGKATQRVTDFIVEKACL